MVMQIFCRLQSAIWTWSRSAVRMGWLQFPHEMIAFHIQWPSSNSSLIKAIRSIACQTSTWRLHLHIMSRGNRELQKGPEATRDTFSPLL